MTGLQERWYKKTKQKDATIWFSFCFSVAQSCLTLCDPMDGSRTGIALPQHLPKFAQIHVHCIGDVIQPSHPLMPSSPSALNQRRGQHLSCPSFFFFPSIRDFSNESVVCIRQPTGSLQFFYFFPTSPLERYPSNSKNVGKKINYYFVLCQELKNILNLILTSTLSNKYYESALTDKEISIQLFSAAASK